MYIYYTYIYVHTYLEMCIYVCIMFTYACLHAHTYILGVHMNVCNVQT